MSKRDVNKVYKLLNHVEHILLRPDRHLGSTRERTIDTWFYDPENASSGLKFSNITFRPALLKLFDEIAINSVDFSKTPEGKHMKKIDFKVQNLTGAITVEDDGGIPVVAHEEYNKGLLPDMLFGELYSSSNYNDADDDLANITGAGQNGEGASLVNVFSKTFSVTTSDGKKRWSRTWRNHMSEADSDKAVVVPYAGKKGTRVSFIPDYSLFKGMPVMSKGDQMMIIRRAFMIAACNPQLAFTLNGRPIGINRFKDFAAMFKCEAIEESENWNVAIYKSDTFDHQSFVNSVHTSVGGPHVDYVLDKIIEHARPKLKRAYKVDYKPGVVKGVIGLVLVCNVNLPRFDSQMKENMTTKVSEFGTKWEPTKLFLEKASASIVKWMGSYHETLVQKEGDDALDDLEKEIKKVSFHKIDKYKAATSKDRSKCTLFLTEGDSAAKPILAARDTKLQGVFPLRGKLINLIAASKKELAKSKEIGDLIAIMGGLRLKGGVDFEKLRYHNIVISTDADVDGLHIRGLIAVAFMKLWPEFIKQGRLKFLISPVVAAKKSGKRYEFFSESEFDAFQLATPLKFDQVKWLKGLGSNDTASFKAYLNDEDTYHQRFIYDDLAEESMNLAFDPSLADDRKPLFETLSMSAIKEL